MENSPTSHALVYENPKEVTDLIVNFINKSKQADALIGSLNQKVIEKV